MTHPIHAQQGNAARLHQAQREADRLHHAQRLTWLESDAPRYACATPVQASHRAQMISASRRALDLIENHGMSLNSARTDP